MSKVVIIPNNGGIDAYAGKELLKLENAKLRMANTILSRSKVGAPEKSSKMVNNAKVIQNSKQTYVIYGQNKTGYAKIQEEGRKWIKKYSKQGSGAHFLENSANSVVKEGLASYMK